MAKSIRRTPVKRSLILALIASIGITACSKTEEPAAKAPSPHAGSAAQAALPNSGKVATVHHAGTYTYVEIEGPNGQKAWVAGGHLDAKAGDTLKFGDYAIMRDFDAKLLGRKFDQVLFVSNWQTANGAMAATPEHGSMPQQASLGGGNSGQVKTVTNAGGYSYLEVASGGGSLWLAVPETKVKAGDKITWTGGSTMQNFNAKSLNRTFDKIVFAGGITVTP